MDLLIEEAEKWVAAQLEQGRKVKAAIELLEYLRATKAQLEMTLDYEN